MNEELEDELYEMNEPDDRPTTCSKVGHILGCSGRAGGDHELRPYTDEERLAVGRWVLKDHILPSEEHMAVEIGEQNALDELKQDGFDGDFIQDMNIDDHLWLRLTRWDQGRKLDEFMLDFTGYDAATVVLYNYVGETEVE